MEKTREQHLEWCKERAIREMDYYKDPKQGLVSLMSDLRKHPETSGAGLNALCAMQLLRNPKMTRQQFITFLEGFN